jgi:hypothetical protein
MSKEDLFGSDDSISEEISLEISEEIPEEIPEECLKIFKNYKTSQLSNVCKFIFSEEIKERKELEEYLATKILENINDANVDIFDFKKYKKEYNLFSKYFKGSELVFRLANYLEYKYVYGLTEETLKDLESKSKNKKFLENITNVINLEKILERFYEKYNPENKDRVDEYLHKYISCENVLLNRLYNKYVAKSEKEKVDEYQELWVADCKRPRA